MAKTDNKQNIYSEGKVHCFLNNNILVLYRLVIIHMYCTIAEIWNGNKEIKKIEDYVHNVHRDMKKYAYIPV